jgi:hypothetical protein
MRALGILATLTVGLGSVSGCGGGDSPQVIGGAGAEGTANAGAGGVAVRRSGSPGAAGDSNEPDGSSGATGRRGDDDDDDTDGSSGAGDCEDGSLGCACYGNDTCDKPYLCEKGLCVGCDDGDEGCSCYGNGTCNGDLTCTKGICVDDRAEGQGGAGGSSSQVAGGSSPEGTGGDAQEGGGGSTPEGTGGSSPEGTGGSSPGGTGGSSPEGTGGQVEGTGGSAPRGCADPYVIDDFEDGDTDACPRSGWTIDWWADGDDYGSSSPGLSSIAADKDVLSVPLDPIRGTSQRALRFQGCYFDDWGAEIGLTFNNPGEEIPQPVDLSQYSGITFWVKGSGTVELEVPTVETMTPEAGGTCDGEWPDCWDYFRGAVFTLSATWTQHSVAFSSLSKEYYGTSMSSANKQDVLNLLFYVGASGGTFDLWLDDVAFY